MLEPNPSLSIVIASGAGGDFLPRCLESLRDQVAAEGAEVIVVDRCGEQTRARIERDYPFVTLVPAAGEPRPSIPELRKIGAMRARADIVALIEEHCAAPYNWLATIRNSFREGDAAIAGPMLPEEYGRVRDWVVYFCEYHNYLPPWPEGERYLLADANIAYRREALLRHLAALGEGYWGVVLHPKLAQEGTFRSVPAMGAYHTGPFNYGYYLAQRYLLSRAWAGTRRERISAAKRLLYLAAAPALPFIFLGRIAQRVFKSGRRIGRFLQAVPLLVPVMVVYVWGEWLGYLVGTGDALERVE
jgi:glycosyltransferase involved in cell wall biosynthesis